MGTSVIVSTKKKIKEKMGGKDNIERFSEKFSVASIFCFIPKARLGLSI